MSRVLYLTAIAVMLSGACAPEMPQEQQVINDAVEALGGAERVRTVTQVVLEGEGTLGNLGQDLTPDAAGQTFTVTDYKRVIDLERDRSRVEFRRTPQFAYFQGQAPQRLVTGVDGQVGYNIAANGNATRVTDAVARDRSAEWHHHPVTLLNFALSSEALVVNPRTEGTERLVDISASEGPTYTLAIDTTTHLPTRISSKTDQANLGDVVIETAFSGYSDVGGLKLPSGIKTTTDGVMTSELRLTNQQLNGEPVNIAAPSSVSDPPPISAPNITADQIAPGTWLLAGQSHHSVLVEFADHLTLIEVPQSELRTLAVIAKARELVPGKPLTEAVTTHHHFDHSAGLRAAVAEGLAIIAQAKAADYYKRAAARQHTIAPDALERKPQPITVRTVDDELTLTDGARTVTLYHVTGSPHADTMLVAYFPRERFIVEADLFTPGAATNPYAANFLENIQRRGLRVDRIVPLHGAGAPFSELQKAVAAATN